MRLFSRRARVVEEAWQPDGSGVVSNGDDCGGDIQRGDSFSVRFIRADVPGSLLTVTFYAAVNESTVGEYFVQRQVERMVCNDPADPGGTEIWSECAYDDIGNDGEFWDSEVGAEWAAFGLAEETLAYGAAEFPWDGQPYNGETA